MSISKLIAVAILIIAQACLALQWLAQMAWQLCILRPYRYWRELQADARKWRAHECPAKPAYQAPEHPHWENEPVANTDSDEDPCTFCDHGKAAHEDDYRCVWPGCDCEAEQYPETRWRPGDPMQFRDLVVDLDGEVTYEKVKA